MYIKPYQLIMICLGCLLLTRSITPPVAHTQDDSDMISITFEALGYDDIRLKGLYGNSSMWVPFQSDWPVEGAVGIELTYTASPLLNNRTAILTVFANNQEVTSFRPEGDGREHTQFFTIPATQRLDEGINLTFAGYLRLTDDQCEDSFNVGQWLIVHNSSRVNASLTDMPAPQLTDLPQAIAVQNSDDPPPILFVLPDEADDLTLTAAAQVAARLGAGISADHLPVRVATASSLTAVDRANANLVVIGLTDNQPLIAELSDKMPVPPTNAGFVSEDGILIPPADGVLQIFTSPWHPRRHILLVSGNDAAGLAMAGQAFTDQDTVQSLTDSFYFIRSAVSRPEPTRVPPWSTPQTTFTQLGEFDRQVIGLGITDSYYFFQYPPGVMLGQRAQLVLHLAFSPALRTQGSYVEVYVNDIYVGAVEAAKVSGNSWIALELPVRALNHLAQEGRGRELNIHLSIANLLPINNCEQINAESSWTKIYADSYFQFDYLPVELPDLYAFPYPFVSLENQVPVRLVVPAAPSAEELQMALSIAALIGGQAITDLDIGVIRGAPATAEAYEDQHLIVIGSLSSNPLLQDLITEIQATALDDIYQVLGTQQTGFFHSLTSPWDEAMSVLAIYGETDIGFKAAAAALYDQGRLAGKSGSIALVHAGEEPVIIYREVGLSRPQIVQPDIILSEIGSQTTMATEPSDTATLATEPSDTTAPAAETDLILDAPEPETASSLTNTEQLILIITAFLVILVVVAALIRIAWRIRA